ncbi:MAG TPA: hypothetical protein VK755_08885 [Candidatus Acidoferrales bacterium]|jgi:hypothetical protein|nr:hypothetical protein [Candidatus Acidoferrales bacterium]
MWGRLAAAALLAGCAVSQNLVSGQVATRSKLGGLERATTSQDLLYVTNSITVDVFSYPRGKLVQTLHGFDFPKGVCADAKGNIWVADTFNDELKEFAHGGKSPEQVLADKAARPMGCAVDPVTGNLAVINGSSPASVAIYPKATGEAAYYVDNAFGSYVGCVYGDNGDLFVDGQGGNSGQTFELAALLPSEPAFEPITIDRSITFAGGLGWDGKQLVVGDHISGNIYEFSISGSRGRLQHTTKLQDNTYTSQFWIQDSAIVSGNSYYGDVHIWPYPKGGDPTKTIVRRDFFPYAVAVSAGTKQK